MEEACAMVGTGHCVAHSQGHQHWFAEVVGAERSMEGVRYQPWRNIFDEL